MAIDPRAIEAARRDAEHFSRCESDAEIYMLARGAPDKVKRMAAALLAAAQEREKVMEEVERLRIAIAWALGESPEGIPEFDPPEGKRPPYWWRKQLREIALSPRREREGPDHG